MRIDRSIFIAIFFSSTAFAAVIDKSDEIKGVLLKSGKIASDRVYIGHIQKTFHYPLHTVLSGITNFSDKCNNELKDKRKYSDKDRNCKYHNEHIVETLKVAEIKQEGWTKEIGERERFLLGRQIYNRGSFGYYELVKIVDGINPKQQKTITVVQQMLSDDEVKSYIVPLFKKDSAFDDSTGKFILTEMAKDVTLLDYEYTAHTSHWILNKEISVAQVFSSISKSIQDLMLTVAEEAQLQSRDLALDK